MHAYAYRVRMGAARAEQCACVRIARLARSRSERKKRRFCSLFGSSTTAIERGTAEVNSKFI